MNHSDLAGFFLQLAVLLSVALVFGRASRRLGLPVIIGEIAGGVLIGKTLLGRVWPDAFSWLFASGTASATAREMLIRLGMLFFLFAVGFEVNLGQVRGRVRSALYTSVFGLVIPLITGFAAVWAVPSLWGGRGSSPIFALLIGSAMAISALPVIARILMDLKLTGTLAGSVILSAATLDDLAGWCLFTAILGAMGRGGAGPNTVVTTGILLLTAAALLTLGRFSGQVVRNRSRAVLETPTLFVGTIAVVTLIVAAGLEFAGLHPVFGAFLIGVVLSEMIGQSCVAHRSVTEFATGFFSPLYFTSIGLRADFAGSFDLVLVSVVLVIACVGKIGGAWLGARLGGLDGRTSLAVGFGMNARGAIEIIIANIALDAGVIDQRVFVALVVMAVVTSVISAPVLARLTERRPRAAEGTPAVRTG